MVEVGVVQNQSPDLVTLPTELAHSLQRLPGGGDASIGERRPSSPSTYKLIPGPGTS
jgi:hypothetical protein